MNEGTHIRFTEGPPNPKTKTWEVVPKDGSMPIGRISFFGRWRKYCFFPFTDTVYEETCLRDIANFCQEQTKEQRKRKHRL